MGKKKAVKKAAAREHEALAPLHQLAGSTAVRALTPLAKATDEPPLLALGVGTLALGVLLRRPAMTRSGARMVASHLVATGLKTLSKASVDRVRPNAAGDRPALGKGHGTDDTDRNAFPSGHTAGAVAVAESIRHEAPGASTPARLAAGAAGALQVTRGAHYASDVVAGAAIGFLSERLASWALDAAARRVERQRDARAEAEAEAHPS
ncbi:phosphatase PAP2 family protein [Sphingomonas sp. BK235]|jgi:membrane-associated phospholipid phosphatase|uniref:phosphatase PAP2 family protein n=1 Tax=Sphingomonas sp. BK235 TaxID=2512131 RepID=UPI0010F0AD2C|nr:phosphatase PAP2 family protein [Sphingomonas sp. BK235]TCP33791.1 undecaprenyl-diphosphatase [Sphingomonas sp. BK235]